MALTELYVDPSIAADSGAGTVGDPYGDLEYCLAQAAFDATNGTRINIKSGTAEVLSAALSLTAFTSGGAPSQTAHLIFQGYASAADDGDWDAQTGIGAIGCDGNTMFASQAYDFMHFRHLEIFGKAGAGYTYLIDIDDYNTFVECELHTHSGTQALLRLNLAGMVIRCHFHTVTSAEMCLYIQSAGLTVMHSYFDLVGSSATVAIYATGYGQAIIGNIIRVDGSGSGIQMPCRSSVCANNSIHSAGGTGDGIKGYTSYSSPAYIGNNIIEGFSGTGGNGFDASTVTGLYTVFANNYVTNCATSYSTIPVYHDDGGNEDIADTTAFTDAANENFTPIDTGKVKGTAWPQSIPSADGSLIAERRKWLGAATVIPPVISAKTIPITVELYVKTQSEFPDLNVVNSKDSEYMLKFICQNKNTASPYAVAVSDISISDEQELIFSGPNKEEIIRKTTFFTDGTDGIIFYICQLNDLDTVGIWNVRVRITENDIKINYPNVPFTVY